jgi:hypothetical protein
VDRCALFVDAGYALGDGALAVHGTRHRDSVTWDYAGLLKLLAELSRDRSGLPVLRCYWYEATVDSRRTPEHETLADIPGLKLRLGKVRPGRREGVETEIRRDLTALARNKAVSDVIIVSAEEDLAQVISDVQDQGLRVAIVHIAADGDWTVSRGLRQECDDIIEISAAHLRPYVDLIPGAEPATGDSESPAAGYPDRDSANRVSALSALSAQSAAARAESAATSLYPAPVAANYPRIAQPLTGSGQTASHSSLHGLFSPSTANDQAGSAQAGSAQAGSAQAGSARTAGTSASNQGDTTGAGDVGADIGGSGTGTGSSGTGSSGANAGNASAIHASAGSASDAGGTDANGGAQAGGMAPGAVNPSSASPRAAGAGAADVARAGSPGARTTSGPHDSATRGGATSGSGEGLGAGSGLGGGQQGQDIGRGILATPDSTESDRQASGLGQPPAGDQPRMPAHQPYQGLEPIRGSLPSSSQPGQGQGQQGLPQQGLPQHGLPQSGMSQNGMSQNGLPQGGLPQGGMSQGGMPMYGQNDQNGQSPNGLPQNGLPQGGMSQNGLPQNGLPQNGLPQNGLPQNGLPQNGLPQNGLPQGGLPQNGMSQNGHPQNGLPQNGPPQHGPPQHGLPQGGLPPVGVPQGSVPPQNPADSARGNTMPQQDRGGLPQNGLPPSHTGPQSGMSQGGMSQNGLGPNGLGQGGLPQSGSGQNGPGQGGPGQGGFTQHSVPPQGSGTGEFPRGGGLSQHSQQGQHSQGGPPNGLPPNGPDSQRSIPQQRQLPAGPGQQYPPNTTAPYGQPQPPPPQQPHQPQPHQPQQPQQPQAPYTGGYGPAVPQQVPSYPPQTSSPYGSLQQPAAIQPSMPQPIAISLADAVQAAHAEGFGFGEAVARDAPALWLEAVLARKPRMPSDLEARLLQGSALPIDSLLHDEVRHALRRGFWDALERSRR